MALRSTRSTIHRARPTALLALAAALAACSSAPDDDGAGATIAAELTADGGSDASQKSDPATCTSDPPPRLGVAGVGSWPAPGVAPHFPCSAGFEGLDGCTTTEIAVWSAMHDALGTSACAHPTTPLATNLLYQLPVGHQVALSLCFADEAAAGACRKAVLAAACAVPGSATTSVNVPLAQMEQPPPAYANDMTTCVVVAADPSGCGAAGCAS